MSKHGLTEFDAVLAIARRGSFRAAALELDLSTTALSNVIGKVERQLGVRLFNRTTRSVSLTDAGRNFVDQIGPAVQTLHDAMGAARSQQETPSGTLRINAFATGAREVLGPLLLKFLRRHPQVHIDLVTEGRIVDIVAEGFDLGLRSADLVPSDMIAVPVGPPRSFAVVASPEYFKANGKPRVPPDLLRLACLRIRLPNGALHRWQFEKDGQPVQIDVQGPITLDEASLARITVLDHVGIGYFMESDVREDIEAGRLVRVLDDWTPLLAPLCLYYPSRRNPSAAFKALIDMARSPAN
ncbi:MULTISPECIES: LysR family transcriptional regulator [Rhizobium]|uniref:HTH-type transcriptional regulator TtuA n=1 Tax=Rhizobium changzhiense TaxID=2692317 RepID=A0A7Z0RIQ4_9HYPH|nr:MULTISPECIES: LysR family transcriptional regulator [Rhizobium]MBA5802041.1 LysR family transcriptional regulator [Rhizobium changzhiense]MCH4548540.1 LysR family transcriptional regulator [Rhizobium changzhiense]MCV9944692.1 LysR family transcriptional regulator [Rhizobium sp. BT-175]MCW0018326.1 LysR family transcriptional regulator [Rhizobium sp. BT-226]NZD60953.1 LysR family transcriptional regulator [Rhizobium changzhiense]